MLEFNQDHKSADLSTIKHKIEKAKKTGKVMLCGITLSAVLLLSGCSKFNANNNIDKNIHSNTSSAIIMENGNAMIIDLQSYDLLSSTGIGSADRIWLLYTISGDKIVVDFESVKFIEGEDSHEKAETIALSLISENGQITCYDEVQSYGKIR